MFIEFFLKGLFCFSTVALLLWIIRWESISYAISFSKSGSFYSPIFYIIKLLSKNCYFNQKNTGKLCIIIFFSLVGGFFQFIMFPLCGNIFLQGREIFTEYYRSENGLALVPITIIFNHIFVGVIKSYREFPGKSMYLESRLACFISSTGILLIILLSLIITYESFDFHEIVKKQHSFFKYGLFLQPVASILFFKCIQIEGNAKLFSMAEKNYYNDLDGIEVFFLNFLEKTRWLCFIILYVFIFLGGYSLIPGLDYIIKIFPKFQHIGEFLSLIFKISIVAFISIIIKNSFLKQRDIDITRLAFGWLIPIAFINFIITIGLKIYQG